MQGVQKSLKKPTHYKLRVKSSRMQKHSCEEKVLSQKKKKEERKFLNAAGLFTLPVFWSFRSGCKLSIDKLSKKRCFMVRGWSEGQQATDLDLATARQSQGANKLQKKKTKRERGKEFRPRPRSRSAAAGPQFFLDFQFRPHESFNVRHLDLPYLQPVHEKMCFLFKYLRV